VPPIASSPGPVPLLPGPGGLPPPAPPPPGPACPESCELSLEPDVPPPPPPPTSPLAVNAFFHAFPKPFENGEGSNG